VTGDRNAPYDTGWRAVDSMYMQWGYTQREPAQHTTHTMANRTRSSSSTHKRSRNSGGSSRWHYLNSRGRSQSVSSSSRNDQNSGASSRWSHPKSNVRQRHQSGVDNGGNESSEVQQMSACDHNDDDDEPWSPRQRSDLLPGASCSFSLNNQGGAVTHPAWHLCLTLTIYRCEHLVLLPATGKGLVGAEMTIPAMNSDCFQLRTPCSSDNQRRTSRSRIGHPRVADRQYLGAIDQSFSQQTWGGNSHTRIQHETL